MKSVHRFMLFIGILILAVVSCNLPASSTPPAAALTAVAQTMTAQAGQNLQGTQPPPAQGQGPATVTVSVATNCRTGPDPKYPLVILFNPGISATIVGKYSPTNYWIIILPNGSSCWLWGQYATVQGDTSKLPEMTPPQLVIVSQPAPTSDQSGNNNSASAPSAPSGVSASSKCAGGRKDTISWQTVKDADGYIIYQEGNKIAKLAKDDVGSPASYVASPGNVEPPITYGVAAYNSAGKSNMVTAKAAGCP